MSEDKNQPASQNDPIPLDPQLTDSPLSATAPGQTTVSDTIPNDPRLSSMLMKSDLPELIGLDTKILSIVVEHVLVNPKIVMENKGPNSTVENQSPNQADTTQQSTEEK